ncbi:MAG: hypothetical protein HRT86_09105 [Ilumatobacteraceae bacterium]|nr:hypothetical protein [Ilumatobacteraceae bacterium]
MPFDTIPTKFGGMLTSRYSPPSVIAAPVNGGVGAAHHMEGPRTSKAPDAGLYGSSVAGCTLNR